jgi:hypothetical protein
VVALARIERLVVEGLLFVAMVAACSDTIRYRAYRLLFAAVFYP